MKNWTERILKMKERQRKKDCTSDKPKQHCFAKDEVTHSRILWYNNDRGSGQLSGHRTHSC